LSNVVQIAAGAVHSLALNGQEPAPLVAFVQPGISNNLFYADVPTRPGRVYALEFKAALGDNLWTSLPLTAGSGNPLRLLDPTPVTGQRFYRVRRW